MRCVTCRRTGFTEEELIAHEQKTGHVRAADKKLWQSSDSFAELPPKAERLTREELIAALRELGPAVIAEATAAKQTEQPAAPAPATEAKP